MTATYASPRVGLTNKGGANLLFDKMKQEQLEHNERLAIEFLNATLDRPIGEGQLHQELKDGVVLCNLVNKLRPGTIKNVGQKNLAFVKMDNITRFLQGARQMNDQLGLNESQLFETIDLFEGKDMPAVINTILTLAELSTKQTTNDKDIIKDNDEESKENNDLSTIELADSNEEMSTKGVDELEQITTDLASCGTSRSGNQDDEGKYRHVRDIFAGLDAATVKQNNNKKSLFRQESFVSSRALELRSTFRSVSSASSRTRLFPDDEFFDNESEVNWYEDTSCPSNTRRPPKSPLRTSTKQQLQLPTATEKYSSGSLRLQNNPELAGVRWHRRPSAPIITTFRCEEDQDGDGLADSGGFTDAKSAKPSAGTKQPENSSKRPQSLAVPNRHRASMAGSLGHKLDQQTMKTIKEINDDDPARETLLLSTNDGATTAQYQLGNCIGKGQFGSVYRALDLATGEIVAVKRIALDGQGDVDQEMMKEVSLLKTLSHSNVIQFLGFIPSDRHINIVLEYAENGSLVSTLKAFGAFPEKLVASFCIKILKGLEYLHSNDVVHCDLKAANILTTKTGDVKLTDFGVSLNLKLKGADDGSVSGTPNWMAPEVIELKGTSTKADIWSLGCTLVELATGKPPYADLIAMSAMFRIVEDDYPPLPENISKEMHSFLLCCFQKNPDDRPTATQLLNHQWVLKYAKSSNNSNKEANTHDVDDGNELSLNAFLQEGDAEYTTHRYIATSFGKAVECKVCGELMVEEAIFCEACALICHEGCKKDAFSCPPKVNDQQPSYDWVFSAKLYNQDGGRRRQPSCSSSMLQENDLINSADLSDHPQAESIRRYSKALGLTPQEQRALMDNPALLSHTLAMENIHHADPAVVDKLMKKRGKKLNGGSDEQCIVC
ncbi:hypothetical protein EC973_009378 [Apophysomyces ossiformis]|uniref:Uncharacterized protein n=1 Tax=Apophysomyces ossiformis TaxID=679940 RepID=A0A8H7BR88_9FUNG|nr:hypothetical protein EC973_009378 [Apophysomyces ossiformis]